MEGLGVEDIKSVEGIVRGAKNLLNGGRAADCVFQGPEQNDRLLDVCRVARICAVPEDRSVLLADSQILRLLPVPYRLKLGKQLLLNGDELLGASLLAGLLKSDLSNSQKRLICTELLGSPVCSAHMGEIVEFLCEIPSGEAGVRILQQFEKQYLERKQLLLLDALWRSWERTQVLPARSIGFQVLVWLHAGDVERAQELITRIQATAFARISLHDIQIWVNELYDMYGMVLPVMFAPFYVFCLEAIQQLSEAGRSRNGILCAFIMNMALRRPNNALRQVEIDLKSSGDELQPVWFSVTLFAWIYEQDEVLKRSLLYVEGIKTEDASMILAQAMVFALLKKSERVDDCVRRLRVEYSEYFRLDTSKLQRDRRWFWLSLLYAFCGKRKAAAELFALWAESSPQRQKLFELIQRGMTVSSNIAPYEYRDLHSVI